MCIYNKKHCHKCLSILIIVIALTVAIVASIWHEQGLGYIIFVSRFFDVMLPILAVGALLKYLLHGNKCHNDDQCKDSCKDEHNDHICGCGDK